MRCTSIKKNNCWNGIKLELTNHRVWCLISFLHRDMIHFGLDEQVRLLSVAIAIAIPITNLLHLLRTFCSIMPSFSTFEACHLTQIFLVIARAAISSISITVSMAIMIVTIVIAVAIMVVAIGPACRRPIVVVGWWGRSTLLLKWNRVVLVECRLPLTVLYVLLLSLHTHSSVVEFLAVVKF